MLLYKEQHSTQLQHRVTGLSVVIVGLLIAAPLRLRQGVDVGEGLCLQFPTPAPLLYAKTDLKTLLQYELITG